MYFNIYYDIKMDFTSDLSEYYQQEDGGNDKILKFIFVVFLFAFLSSSFAYELSTEFTGKDTRTTFSGFLLHVIIFTMLLLIIF